MKKFLLIVLLSVFTSFAQSDVPIYEMRGVWVATVTNLDWPSSPNLTVEQQKKELIDQFENIKLAGANAIFFQVRTECDALYDSPYEPWSYYLTGQQGKAPVPFYDPLTFAIEEAHKRGMELHAWFNPYRAVKTVGNYAITDSHITKTNPELILTIADFKFLNPGLPEVEEYIKKIIVDVAKRYNVDGIHMDDYFYPYPPNNITNQDTATFRLYNKGIALIGDWRRDNVNRLIAALHDTLNTFKPELKFGMSPFGIWRPGFPAGISGMDAYNTIYCDAINWIQNRKVDYITPQLYWPFGDQQDYAALARWWSDSTDANRTHLYIGKAGHKANSYSPSELHNQIRFDRNISKIQGTVFFEGINFMQNPKGLVDSLRANLYKKPAIIPSMEWKVSTALNAPSNLRLGIDPEGKEALMWDAPAGPDTAQRYLVSKATPSDTNNLVGISGLNYLPMKYADLDPNGEHSFVVQAMNYNSALSAKSNVLNLTASTVDAPVINYPAPVSPFHYDTVKVSWNIDPKHGAYSVQVSKDSAFTKDSLIVDITNYKMTTYTVRGLAPQTTYYVRLRAVGFTGESGYSSASKFTTAFPTAPELVYPAHASTLTTNSPQLKWAKKSNALRYRVQVSIIGDFTSLVKDTTTSDTSFTIYNLALNKVHYWRVSAINNYGPSVFSKVFGFKTPVTISSTEDEVNTEIPDEYKLDQNYPNPFNPRTTIHYSIKEPGLVKLNVYNLLGNQVATVVDQHQSAGNHTIEFDASRLSSGVYFYIINVNDFSATKKMTIIK